MTYMEPETFLTLSQILRGAILNQNDGEALNGLRAFRKKFEATGAYIHDVLLSSNAGAYGVIERAIEQRKEAQRVARIWETESQEFLRELAADRGGYPPESATFRHSKGRSDTNEEVAERHAKRTAWEIKEAVRRNAELKRQIVAKDNLIATLKSREDQSARIAELEARLAKVLEAVR